MTSGSEAEKKDSSRVRLDKWLWAARFFKTRSLAKQAIEGGKVHYNGERCKVSKEVELDATLTIRLGYDIREVLVLGLSDQRRGAPEAQKLYRETAESIEQRELRAAQRRAFGPGADLIKPNKKQRRQIHRFKIQNQTEPH